MPRWPLLLLALALFSACKKEAQLPPPPPPQQMCARVERGTDHVLEMVPCSGRDADGDGVDDAVDHCPDHPETINGILDLDGCPDPDRDGDLIVDYEDACPDEPGVPPDGCPAIDSDGDGIPDHLDACPYEPEDMDGDRDDDGCPEGPRDGTVARSLDEQLWQKARVEVVRGRARANRAGKATLEELAAMVATRPDDITRVRLVGYASLREVGRGKTKDLARARVKLVEQRLVAAGVPARLFERALYPLKGKKERVGRVDVMVFLELAAAMKGDDDDGDTQLSQPAAEPHLEPDAASDEDWDLPVQ